MGNFVFKRFCLARILFFGTRTFSIFWFCVLNLDSLSHAYLCYFQALWLQFWILMIFADGKTMQLCVRPLYLTFQTSLPTGMLTCLCFALVSFHFGFVTLWLHFILVLFHFGFISFWIRFVWVHFVLDLFRFGFVSQSTVSRPVLHHACRPDCVVLYNLTSMPL